MSLLTQPRHVVDVQPYRQESDRYGKGKWVPDGDRVSVPCSVQPTAQEERQGGASNGTTAYTEYTLYALEWPWGSRTRVYYGESEFEQIGDAAEYRMGVLTQHRRVHLLKVGSNG